MKPKTIPIFLVFFSMGFGDAVGTLVGFVTKVYNLSPAVAGLLPFFGFLAFWLFSVPLGIFAFITYLAGSLTRPADCSRHRQIEEDWPWISSTINEW